MNKIGYSLEEAADVIGVRRTKMCELVAAGEVESVKIGRRRIVPAAALDEFIQRLRGQQAGKRRGA